MGIEIERKFLIKDISECRNKLTSPSKISQGVLSDNPNRFVRIRIAEHDFGDCTVRHGYITIKGKMEGLTRKEWEFPIPFNDAQAMLDLCIDKTFKTRYLVDYPYDNNLKWEIDVFKGENLGLILAEIEIPSEDYEVKLPDWIGKEVSTDPRYTNAYLGKHPYLTWSLPSSVPLKWS